jgi:hypothetical protein
VVWLTAKPIPAWFVSIPKEPVYMLTVDAKRGKHLHKWVPWMRESRIEGFDANGCRCDFGGDEVLAGLNKHSVKPGLFGHAYKDDIHNHWVSTAVIHRKRIIRSTQVEFVVQSDDAA